MSGTDGYVGFRRASDVGSETGALRFLVKSALSEVATAHLVTVVNARSNGEVAPPGTLDVQILVHQIDGDGNAHPHGPIYNVPYHRAQNGANGIIIDPKAGDVGVIVCASRDISAVKANKGDPSTPGSLRRHDLADALYIGTVIAKQAPTQYVQFTDEGLSIVSPGTITIQSASVITLDAQDTILIRAPSIVFQGNVTWNGVGGGHGTMVLDMDVTHLGSMTSNGKHIDSTHIHSSVQRGGGDTDPPAN